MNDILNLLNPWWHGQSFETGIRRTTYYKKLLQALDHKRVVLIVGSRRVGKTTLFYQLIGKLLKTIPKTHILYALMDHPQISSYTVFELLEQFRKQFRHDRKKRLYLFLDEIQYINDWERQIKALTDTENVKIFLSGSASSQILLKSPFLTGRVEKIEVYPLDFKEFLTFRNAKISVTESYKFESYLNEYLKIGGYPEYVLKTDPSYFSDLINNILYKDIVSLYQIRNPDLLKDLLLLIADRVGSQTTYAKLASILTLKNDTVKEYIYYLKNTLLVDELPRYSSSRSHRIYGPKKFYIADNGILFHLLGKLSYSQAFEQTLFRHFRKHNKKVGFYYENQKEVDFVLDTSSGRELIEAKYQLQKTLDDVLEQYILIAKSFTAKKFIFITRSWEQEKTVDNMKIKIIPLWRILLQNS